MFTIYVPNCTLQFFQLYLNILHSLISITSSIDMHSLINTFNSQKSIFLDFLTRKIASRTFKAFPSDKHFCLFAVFINFSLPNFDKTVQQTHNREPVLGTLSEWIFASLDFCWSTTAQLGSKGSDEQDFCFFTQAEG